MHRTTEERPPFAAALPLRALGLVLLLGLLGAGAGSGYLQLRDPAHVATATVLVHPLEGNPYASAEDADALVSLETEAQVVRSDAVARLVRSRLPGSPPAPVLREGVTVAIPPNTQVLQISTTATTPERARQQTDVYARAYLDHRRAQARRAVAAELAAMAARTRALTEQLEAAGDGGDEGSDAGLQQSLVTALNDQLVQLRTDRISLQGALPSSGAVLTAAGPASFAGPPGWLVVAAGAATGVLLGLAVALGWHRRRWVRQDPLATDPVVAMLAPRGDLEATPPHR